MSPTPTTPETPTIALRDLDPAVHRILVGFAFSALGSGLTMPFLYVYLSQVRGIPTSTVGWVFAWMGLLGFLAAPACGSVVDRFGPRPAMVLGIVVEATGTGALSLVRETWHAFAVAAVIVVGNTLLWPANTSMLTRLVPTAARERIYGLNFMMLNAGLGLGGVVSSLLIDVDSPRSFERLYLVDAATYLVYLALVLTLPRGTGAHVADPEDPAAGAQPSWGVVLRDTRLLRVVAVSILAITFGYAQMEAGFTAFAVDVAGVPARSLGWAFAANTAVIVAGQMLAVRFIDGRRRSRMLALTAGMWSVAWVVIAAADLVPTPVAIASIVLGMAVFGLGETFWAPVAPAIVNDLAPEEMRGRYNALQGMTWTVGGIIGPGLAGVLIGHGLAGAWVGCVVGGCALAALLFLRLGRHLTPAQDGL